ncbi:hypothetical protein LTR74_012510 [Friedmanniomyces endolithicus]|nr:hypothetical protein LTR74_012510 [Friedmanniomyces endolithicus]
MAVGDVLRQHRVEFAQPRVQHVLGPPSDFIPRSEPAPPIDTGSSNFITTADAPLGFSLLHRHHQLTISMPEPRALSLQHLHEKGTGEIGLRVLVRAMRKEAEGSAPGSMVKNLQNLRFALRPAIYAKTCYATRPFLRAPSRSMVDFSGSTHLHESVIRLPEQSLSATSWQRQSIDLPPSQAP